MDSFTVTSTSFTHCPGTPTEKTLSLSPVTVFQHVVRLLVREGYVKGLLPSWRLPHRISTRPRTQRVITLGPVEWVQRDPHLHPPTRILILEVGNLPGKTGSVICWFVTDTIRSLFSREDLKRRDSLGGSYGLTETSRLGGYYWRWLGTVWDLPLKVWT